ncbi:MAG TPA: DUF5655 domain-containing protein [Streptosporangiaceae bacterium]|jgi:hypothetical protein
MTADDEWTVQRHLEGATPDAIALYERFIALAGQCGPFRYRVTKTSITLKGTRRGFAGAVPRNGVLRGYLDLTRQVSDPRILSSAPYTKRLYVHQFRITALDQLDGQFAGWLAEAYAVGQGAHLAGPPAAG